MVNKYLHIKKLNIFRAIILPGHDKSLTQCYWHKGLPKAYFRCGAETRRDENISARLSSARHVFVLDEENLVVLKQLYWWYAIEVKFKAKENKNKNLRN